MYQCTLLLKITAGALPGFNVPISMIYFLSPDPLSESVFSSSWARTNDLPVNSRVLCLLSYRGCGNRGTRTHISFNILR